MTQSILGLLFPLILVPHSDQKHALHYAVTLVLSFVQIDGFEAVPPHRLLILNIQVLCKTHWQHICHI